MDTWILSIGIGVYYFIKCRCAGNNKISFAIKGINPLFFLAEITVLVFIFSQLGFDVGVPDIQPLWAEITGIIVFLCGVSLGSMGRLTLKNNYRPAVVAHKPQEIVTSGPYKIVRHPIHTGTFIMGIGFEITLYSPLIALVMLALPLLLYQISKEEGWLSEHFPEEWPAFKQKTPYKFMPFVF